MQNHACLCGFLAGYRIGRILPLTTLDTGVCSLALPAFAMQRSGVRSPCRPPSFLRISFITSTRVLTADSPLRARRQEHLPRARRLRRERGGPVRGHPQRGYATLQTTRRSPNPSQPPPQHRVLVLCSATVRSAHRSSVLLSDGCTAPACASMSGRRSTSRCDRRTRSRSCGSAPCA